MVFQLVVEGPRPDGAAPAGASSVRETIIGPTGEELPANAGAVAAAREGADPVIDELKVSDVRLFRTGGLGVAGQDPAQTGAIGFDGRLPVQRTSMLLLVGVPVELSLRGLMRFFGPSLQDCVETLRVLRWTTPAAAEAAALLEDGAETLSGDFYSVVLLCSTQATADALYQQHHGRILRTGFRPTPDPSEGITRTDSLGGPCCYLLFLEGVAYREGAVARQGDSALDEVPNVAVELPMCPFCLERLDVSVTGMITHNAGWLSSYAWDVVPHSTCCAACATIARVARTPTEVGAEEGPFPACQRCASSDELWVCLVCGHLGCGRYARGHAKDHAREEEHHFCLDLASGRIWHYAGDVFVHRRLVQMWAASGRFEVALPEPADEGARTASSSALPAGEQAKGPAAMREGHLAMELDAVLASQLDHQRSLYEARLRGLDEQHGAALREIFSRQEALECQLRRLDSEAAEAHQEQRRLERKCSAARASQAKAGEAIEFAKEVNRSLLANRAEMRKAAGQLSGASGAGAAASGSAGAGGTQAPEEDALVAGLRKKVALLMERVSAEGNSAG